MATVQSHRKPNSRCMFSCWRRRTLWPVVSMAYLRAREQDVHLMKKSQSSQSLKCGFLTTETRRAPGTEHSLAEPLPSSRRSLHPDLITSPTDTTASAQTHAQWAQSLPGTFRCASYKQSCFSYKFATLRGVSALTLKHRSRSCSDLGSCFPLHH